jgi:membrane-bound ClpP family serine protease
VNEFVALASATGDTANLQSWIKDNIIPLLLLLIAVMLFVFAQRGDNAKAMRVVAGVVIALGVLGIATTGRADDVGTWLAGLVTG